MIRYLILSTAIVLAIAVVVAGWTNRDLIRIKLASVYARVPTKAGAADVLERGSAAPLSGDAPWALSALPECLIQTSESTGSPAYVRAHLPPGAATGRAAGDAGLWRLQHYVLPATKRTCGGGPTGSGSHLACSFTVRGDLLALIRRTAQGAELRVYAPAKQ